MPIGIYWLLGIILLLVLSFVVIEIALNRNDGTPLWEPVVLCILVTPVLALFLEMLKPYKPQYIVQDKKDTNV